MSNKLFGILTQLVTRKNLDTFCLLVNIMGVYYVLGTKYSAGNQRCPNSILRRRVGSLERVSGCSMQRPSDC